MTRIRGFGLRHFHLKHYTLENKNKIRDEQARLQIWKDALIIRWAYHVQKERSVIK